MRSSPVHKPASAYLKIAHLSLTLVGLMWVLPFLYYDSPHPIASFYQEWGAAVLGVCALILLSTPSFWQAVKIPRIVLLPLGLAMLVLLQWMLGKSVYGGLSLTYILYLLWAALLIILGRYLYEELGLPTLATMLAIFLLVGAELSAVVGVLQHYAIHIFDPFVVAVNSPAVIGNMGQANHFADYLTLGLISLGLLYGSERLRGWHSILLATPLLFVLVLSGSRSPWLYFSGIAGLAWLWQRRDPSCAPLLRYSLLLLPGFALMQWVAQLSWLAGPYGTVTTMQRMLEAGTHGSIRLSIWQEAWLIFTAHPLLGAGFGQFPWQHFQLGPVLRDSNMAALNDYVEHAHNLVLNVAAEMGVAGLLVLFSTTGLWLMQAWRAPRTLYHWWGYALLLVLAIHSMLEYPLWYTYFLGVAALLLGMLDSTHYRLPWKRQAAMRVGQWSAIAVVLSGLLGLFLLLQDYRKLSGMATLQVESAQADSYTKAAISRQVHDEMVLLQGQALLLRPYVESVLAEAGWNHIADHRALNERVMHFTPTSPVVYRQALLLARDGQQAAAQIQMERAIWIFPGNFPAVREQLQGLAQIDRDPARFPALLEFALQKYQEQQAVIGAKDGAS